MFNLFINAAITIIVATASLFGIYNYIPLDWLNLSVHTPQKLGNATSITTIAGTDTLSSSRTTINNNFSSLNTNKLEITGLSSTTTLPSLTTAAALVTVGTITTGTWTGTTIAPANGGTGSTTLSANQILLGNGTTQLKVVKDLGTSGQFLTSQGAGSPPQWTTGSVDQTLNYNWSGVHIFNSTVATASSSPTLPITVRGNLFIEATTTASAFKATTSAMSIGGLNTEWPGALSATSSSALLSKGSTGKLYFDSVTATTTVLIPKLAHTTATSTIMIQQTGADVNMVCALYAHPFQILANKVSISIGAATVAGTADLTLYKDTGQQVFSVTTASISAKSTVTTSLASATLIDPGNYYFCWNTNANGTNVGYWAYGPDDNYSDNLEMFRGVSGEQALGGTVSISSGAPPATLVTTSASLAADANNSGAIIYRLDN